MTQGPPYYADYMNVIEASNGYVHANDTIITRYFRRYLLQRAISVFRWNIPEAWERDSNFLLYCLYCWGYVAVFETDKFGVIFQPCGLYGYDVYYQPTHAIISNPLIDGAIRPRIGQQCEILRLQPDYGGIMDIVNHYAELLSIATETARVNLFNSKLAYVFFAENKAGADAFNKLYDQLAAGKPASVIDKALKASPDGSKPWDLFSQNVGQNYIADNVLSDMRKIEAMFDTDIGIPNANTDKRERLISDEVNSNNIEVQAKASLWLDELKKSCKRVNNMFGLNLSVDWRFKEGGAQDESHIDNSRTV